MSTRILLALVAVAITAAAAGAGAITLGARNAILEARQDVYLETFARTSSQVVAALTDDPSDEELGYAAARMAVGAVLVDLDSQASGGDAELAQVSRELRAAVETSQSPTQFRRTHVDGVPTFVVGARFDPDSSRPGRDPIVMYAFYSLDTEYAQVEEFLRVAGLTTLIVALAATAVGFFVAGRLRRPLTGLQEAIAEIGRESPVVVGRTGYPDIDSVLATLVATDAALEDTMRRLRRNEEEARRLVADVAHELRTPLTAMVAVAEILEDVDGSTHEEVRAAGAVMARSTRHLARLTEDILAMSRSDAGTVDLTLSVVRLEDLALDIVETRGWAGVEVRIQEGLTMNTDPARVTLIVVNLLGNARLHGRAPITLAADTDTTRVRIVVHDAGPGVPVGAEDLVFERFFKVATDRGRSESSGLGLAIVRESARQLGGEVHYRPGDGATFEVTLPVG